MTAHSKVVVVVLGSVLISAVAVAFASAIPAGFTPAPDAAIPAPAAARAAAAGGPREADTRRAAPEVAATGGLYRAPAGTELSFDFATEVDVRSLQKNQTATRMLGLTLRGTWRWLVVGRREDRILCEVSCPSLQVTPSGPESAADFGRAMVADLARTTTVLLRDDGLTLGYRFPADLSAQSRNQLRTLVSVFRFVLHPAPETEWSGEEDDATGTAQVAYRWTRAGEQVQRERRAYRTSGTQPADAGMLPRPAGVASARYSAALGWIESAELREEITTRIEDLDVTLVHRITGTLRLTGSTSRAAGVPDWDAPFAAAAGCADNQTPEDSEKALFERALKNVTLAQLLEQIARLTQAGKDGTHDLWKVREQLLWMMRLRPEVVAELRRQILAGTLDTEVCSVVLSAAAGAGTDAGEGLVLEVAAESQCSETLRVFALRAMIQWHKPSERALATLQSVLADAGLPADARMTGTLVLGRFAAGEVPAQRDAAVAELLGQEQLMAQRGETHLWLEALGNSGSPAVLPKAAQYLQSVEPDTRASALNAIRRVSDQAALDTLLERATRDDSDLVRGRALELLVNHPRCTPASWADAYLREPSPQARRAALYGVGDRGREPAMAQAIARLAEREQDPELRQRIGELAR